MDCCDSRHRDAGKKAVSDDGQGKTPVISLSKWIVGLIVIALLAYLLIIIR